jgi:hypothetical protein
MTKDFSKIAVIDTENHSADLYAHLGAFNVLALDKPFTPERYIEAMEVCEQAGMKVIVLDSVSQEWETILEIHGAMVGNSFTNWGKVSPRHSDFVQKILQSPCHIIATIRSKQDYVLTEKNGKMVPEKVGLKGITRDGMDYELTIVLDLDIKHQATASKDRTNLFMDKPQFMVTDKTGELIRNWCESGKSLEAVKEQVYQASTVEELRNILRQYPDYRSAIEPLAIQKKNILENPIVERINT